MRINVKVRFDSQFPKFENVMNNNYIIYCNFPNDEKALEKIKEVFSRKLGVPIGKIHFLTTGRNGEWIFEIED